MVSLIFSNERTLVRFAANILKCSFWDFIFTSFSLDSFPRPFSPYSRQALCVYGLKINLYIKSELCMAIECEVHVAMSMTHSEFEKKSYIKEKNQNDFMPSKLVCSRTNISSQHKDKSPRINIHSAVFLLLIFITRFFHSS